MTTWKLFVLYLSFLMIRILKSEIPFCNKHNFWETDVRWKLYVQNEGKIHLEIIFSEIAMEYQSEPKNIA